MYLHPVKHQLRSFKSMKKFALLSLALLALFSFSTMGVVQPAAAQNPVTPETITVIGVGTAYAEPDIAYITMAAEVLNPDVTAAVEDSNARTEAIYAALASIGIAEADVRTENFYIWQETSYTPEGTSLPGNFRVSNTIRVTVRDVTSVPLVLTAALEAGATAIQNVWFSIADTSALEAEARELAVADALATAQELAGLNGVTVGAVVAISEYNYGSGPVYPDMYGFGGGGGGGASVPPINAGALGVTINVQISYQLVAGN